jgi:hypothetical protein
VINKILFLMEIEFIVARNVVRGYTPAEYSKRMGSLRDGVCHPTRRRGTKLRQQKAVRVENQKRWVVRHSAKIKDPEISTCGVMA